ncbi:hypothetical protein F4802DRAFT_618586 [Xylaria palmicola]|nr:hypothetical protein F4802DRAFT_618586 [Xylaria palmicola]
MARVRRALLALAITMAPVLAAPGPVFAALHQQPLQGAAGSLHGLRVPPAVNPPPPAPPGVVVPGTRPAELSERKSGKHRPSINMCTPGDRFCHASLQSVLVCNDDSQWVTYADCADCTFCHRLHLICVPEIFPPNLGLNYTGLLREEDGDGDGDDDGGNDNGGSHDGDVSGSRCKEGDRRCSPKFNRVDRCNSDAEWVDYHDCRKSETCDEGVLECLPRVADPALGLAVKPNATRNATATKTK